MMQYGREWDWQINEENNKIQIEEILTEANAYNLRSQVQATAEAFIKDDPDLDKVSAYQMAYLKLIE
jgi:hypothetical protein|tara:strand:+ start:652 stop:852 length:201 start_codon:yes stop_codon:yes gene_type:complete